MADEMEYPRFVKRDIPGTAELQQMGDEIVSWCIATGVLPLFVNGEVTFVSQEDHPNYHR
jgi:hypothetical protein